MLRQAISNFEAALAVPNRSACLLYYYSMLNFAKAELLNTQYSQVIGFVGHGLSFSPSRAKSVAGDSLTVRDGVFKLIYEKRTGHSIPNNTRLPVKRLLANIPEVGQQVTDANLGACAVAGLVQMIATNSDTAECWPVLGVISGSFLDQNNISSRLFLKYFEPAEYPDSRWRDHFGFSRRDMPKIVFYQSRRTLPPQNGQPDISGAMKITMDSIGDLISLRTMENFDAWLTPSLYATKRLWMPPALARYAITYYASSLVRYRPSIFDAQLFPEHAYMFDAIARECALPMLIDTLSSLEGRPQLFYAPDAMRI